MLLITMDNEDNINPIFDHKDGEFFKNFAILIPQGPFKEPPKPTIPKWKRLLCFIIGHKWRIRMVTTFEKTMPEECQRCHKKRWLKATHWIKRLGRFIKRINKCIDKALRPLCYFGIHRWKQTYGVTSYCYGPNCEPARREEHYRCARCKSVQKVVL